MTNSTAPDPATDLVARSNALGADPRNTNYAGGNTSAKGTVTDPVTSEPTELLWVKGSGGDLGTLTEAGLAVLRLDRLRALVDVYPGVEREDEMVAAFDYCLHGRGGAAPSIDTAMHGLVDAPHIDHLHPDSGIALATAADGEALTKECFGDRVAWVDWRRPGFQLGLDIAEVKRTNPQAIGVVLGGHGITAWGDTSEECAAALAGDHPHRRGVPRRARQGRAVRSRRGRLRGAAGGRAAREGRRPRPRDPRPRVHRRPAARALQRQRGRAGVPLPREPVAARRARHLVPRPLPAHQGPPAGGRPAGVRVGGGDGGPAARAARGLPRGVRRLLRPARHARQPGHARRRPGDRAGARGRDVLLRQGQADRAGGRRVLRQRHQRDARRRGGLDVRTDRREREVPHRVLVARGGQAPADAEAQAAGRPGRAGHRRRLRHRQGDRRAPRRRGRLRGGRRPRRRGGAAGRLRDRYDGPGGRRDRERHRRGRRAGRGRRGGPRVRRRRPGRQQRRAVDLASRCWRPPRRTGTSSTT